MQFLMIDGEGGPHDERFQQAIEVLFSTAYTLKFAAKQEMGFDYTVMPLEGLWWAERMEDFVKGLKENWKWTLMIFQPDVIRSDRVHQAVQKCAIKKPHLPYDQLYLKPFTEGWSAQVLHIGPFAEEHANVMRLHELIHSSKGSLDGLEHKHHEIYLSDFRKVAPEKMRTVLRQPFKPQV